MGEVNFADEGSSPVLSEREKREFVARCGHWKECMRMPGDRPLHGDLEQPSSCVAACGMAAPATTAVHPPFWHCRQAYPPPFLFF